MFSKNYTLWFQKVLVILLMSVVFVIPTSGDTYTQWTDAVIYGSMTSSTLVAAPDGTSSARQIIGLGEQVMCSIDSSFWYDYDCNITKNRIEFDTIGDRVWGCTSGGTVNPSGATGFDYTYLTADMNPGSPKVAVLVYDSGTKFNDAPVYKSRQFSVIAPTDETTSFVDWMSSYPTISRFKAQLTPTSVSFGNISVTEKDGTGSHDDCWFVGSAYSKFDSLTGGTWAVADNNYWQYDHIGWFSGPILYYRAYPAGSPSAPCATNLAQEMHVVQGSSGMYTSGTLVLHIGTTTISNTRDGANGNKTWP